MIDLIKHLNNKIIINDLIVKKMKYEVNMLFYDYPSKDKAKILAKKINGQLDTALVGLQDDDKEAVRRELIENSFLVLPNPVSDHINYGHVFTTLTNFDDDFNTTEKRLTHWLDLNTEVDYDEGLVRSYISRFKITPDMPSIKSAAIEYVPKARTPLPEDSSKYRMTKRAIWIPVSIVVIIAMSFMMKTRLPKVAEEPGPLYDKVIDHGLTDFINEFYQTMQDMTIDPYAYATIDTYPVYTYLKAKDSALVTSDYLTTIDQLSAKFDVNPLLLVAIIGQEQGFVPSDHEYVDEIMNNPYNVFGSWVDYNTDFVDATNICLNTIETARSSLPDAHDLVDWLGKTYAEDENWSQGVKLIFTKLQSLN